MKAKLIKADPAYSWDNLKCPHCECKIEDDANYGDSDYCADNDPETDIQSVTCPECKKEFELEIEVRWTYKAKAINNLEDDNTRAITKEEVRAMFLSQCGIMSRYWSNTPDIGSVKERTEGTMFSLFNIIDGCSGGFPCSIDLVLRPHPDNKQFHIDEGENWIEDGMVINDDCLLHEQA